MRYDTPIFFQSVSDSYDRNSGNYDENITEEKLFANVTDSGTDTLRLVYNELKQGSLTIRLQRPYKKPFERIRVSGKIYRADFTRGQKTFVVSEVQ